MKRSFHHVVLTPSTERIVARFQSVMLADSSDAACVLLMAIVADESLGGGRLRKSGLTMPKLRSRLRGGDASLLPGEFENESTPVRADETCTSSDNIEPSWVQAVLERARFISRRSSGAGEVSSDHLVEAITDFDNPARRLLAEFGVEPELIREEFGPGHETAEPIAVDFELTANGADEVDSLHPEDSSETIPVLNSSNPAAADVLPLIDAGLNRAREGLRVLEDFTRFVSRDADTTRKLKQLRHDLVQTEQNLAASGFDLQSARNVAADVGTGMSTTREMHRTDLTAIVFANSRRVQESLRSLEEFGKTVCTEFAAAMKQLRYRSYSLEQAILAGAAGRSSAQNERDRRLRRLDQSFLYVLVTEELCRASWKKTVSAALDGGADIIQLREKRLSDEQLIERSHWIADACREASALFILNDRSDLAHAARADGVHIGQTDGTAQQSRRELQPDQLLGVSTHNGAQLAAAGNSADYVGVGPVFTSQTKSFQNFAGPEFVAEAAETARLPWFAIGGINCENIAELRQHGATRIAVSAAVIGSDQPAKSARELRSLLRRDCDTPADHI